MIKRIPHIKIQFFFLILMSLFNVLALIFENAKVLLYFGGLIGTIGLFGVNIFGFYRFRKNNMKFRKNIIYIVLCIWTLYIIFIGLQFNYDYLRNIFLSPYMLLPYLFIFFVQFFKIEDYKNIMGGIYITNILFLLIFIFTLIFKNSSLISTNYIEDCVKYLCYPNFLMFLGFSKLSSKQKVVCILVFVIGFLMAVIGARRSLVWVFTWALMLFIFINYLSRNASKLKKLTLIVMILMIGFGITILYNLYSESLFGGLIEKIDKDTRGAVLNDFYKDMDTKSWILGRGIGGEYNLYETDYVFGADNEMLKTRNIIEAGYLNYILNGGIIYLVLFSILILVALINGIFRSKNYYIKVCSAFIVLYVIEFIPAGVSMFNIRFFLLWFCIAMCWKKIVFEAENKQIEESFE